MALTKVGSPPMVRRTSSASASRSSTARPSRIDPRPFAVGEGQGDARLLAHPAHLHMVSNSTSAGSCAPVIGAAEAGAGVAASGICPSAAKSPEVGSSPIQPAPGR